MKSASIGDGAGRAKRPIGGGDSKALGRSEGSVKIPCAAALKGSNCMGEIRKNDRSCLSGVDESFPICMQVGHSTSLTYRSHRTGSFNVHRHRMRAIGSANPWFATTAANFSLALCVSRDLNPGEAFADNWQANCSACGHSAAAVVTLTRTPATMREILRQLPAVAKGLSSIVCKTAC